MSRFEEWQSQQQQDGPPINCSAHGIPEYDCLQCEIDRLEGYRQRDEEEMAEMKELLFAVVESPKYGGSWHLRDELVHQLRAWAKKYGK